MYLAIQTDSRPLDKSVEHKTSPQTKHGKSQSSIHLCRDISGMGPNRFMKKLCDRVILISFLAGPHI